jgi:hypothetical protein
MVKVRFEKGSIIDFCAWDKDTQPMIVIEQGCNLMNSGLRHQSYFKKGVSNNPVAGPVFF